MPWEGAAKPSVKLPFLYSAPSTPQLRVCWCTAQLLPWLHIPVCRVTQVRSLPHTRKRVPRPRPALLSATPPHWCDSARHGQWLGPGGRDMDISPGTWNASSGGTDTGSGSLSGPWYGTHKVSAHPAAPRGLGERGVLISASLLCSLNSPIPAPVCCWLCSLLTPLFSLLCPGSPSKQSFLSRSWAELFCSVRENHWFLSSVFLSLSVLTMDLGNCKRETEATPGN